jgi:Zn-finger nucleic acid-binding protein
MVTIRCRACNNEDKNTFRLGNIAPFVADRMLDGKRNKDFVCECPRCGLLWLDINPTEKQLSQYYNGYFGEEYYTQRVAYEPGFKDKWNALQNRNANKYVEAFLEPIIGVPETVLDFGGGNGKETPFRGQSFIDILDIDTTDLLPGCNRIDKIEKKYDLVILSHVLEHVPRPKYLLNDALNASKEYVYIEVPNEAIQYGPRPRFNTVMEKRGAWHEHINYFDSTSLEYLARICRAEVHAMNIHSWENGNEIQMLVKRG